MRQSISILGLNSGTSADGLDLSVIQFSPAKGGAIIRFVAGSKKRYPAGIRRLVEHVAGAKQVSIEEIVFLDNILGKFYGQTAAAFIRTVARRKISVDAVASHGQTVRHVPKKTKLGGYTVNGTLQLGSLEQIAAATLKVVTGDFRQADVALGNEGAPITVAAMARLFADPHESRLIVNIGGMANYFYFPANGVKSGILAADTGPGNSLCDIFARKLFDRPYDRGGRLAAAGQISKRLLSALQAHSFFHSKVTSTGREEFGADMAERTLHMAHKLHLTSHDIMATAAELSVTGISHEALKLAGRDAALTKLYLTGGGSHNDYVRRRLAHHLPMLDVASVGDLGIDPDLVEASAYAVMGYACLRSEPLQTVFRAGRKQKVYPILGRIVQPPMTDIR
jgi:anhydro-N-acetylmuramic acid kinase